MTTSSVGRLSRDGLSPALMIVSCVKRALFVFMHYKHLLLTMQHFTAAVICNIIILHYFKATSLMLVCRKVNISELSMVRLFLDLVD